jgi:hypothetical protein
MRSRLPPFHQRLAHSHTSIVWGGLFIYSGGGGRVERERGEIEGVDVIADGPMYLEPNIRAPKPPDVPCSECGSRRTWIIGTPNELDYKCLDCKTVILQWCVGCTSWQTPA